VQNSSVTEPFDSNAHAAVLALTRAARLLERALPELSMADFRMLSAVAGGEARASRLAHRLAVGKPTVSATVDSLVRRGLLTREVHGPDQRAVDLALTPAGEAARARAETALATVVVDVAARTSDPTAVLASLAAFGDGLEAVQAERAASLTRGGAR
jgi:DNA-binding MarR family transcriptional regulator